MRTVILNAEIINEGERFIGSLILEGEEIIQIIRQEEYKPAPGERIVNATGMILVPGAIDDHVHMRDPGLTHKGDMVTETAAAAAGGVTTVFDMPNVVPQTTSLDLLKERYAMAQNRCSVNYAFFLGATRDNLNDIVNVDITSIPGIKLFMGSSTGNMLVDEETALDAIFAQTPTLLMTHCEDTDRINHNMQKAVEECVCDDPDVTMHPQIRDAEACLMSTQLAVKLALKHGTQLHVAHLSTQSEVELLKNTANPNITAEACVAHLIYTDQDYARLGTRIKCNPAIKAETDRKALRMALADGRIDVVGTDHAPHLLTEKQGGCLKAVSGMPMVQFSLVTMLELVDEGVLELPLLVEKMCHAPARLFQIKERGYLRPGYKADLVLVRPNSPWMVTTDNILSKCGWSPMEGHTYRWRVEQTFVNGQSVYANGEVNDQVRGQRLEFDR